MNSKDTFRRHKMGYWNDVKGIVSKGIDIAVEGLKEGAETAVEKGKDGVSYVQLKKDLFTSHRKLHDLLADLGDVTHDLYKAKGDIYADRKLQEIMADVVKVEDECIGIEKEIEKLGAEEGKK